MTQNCIEIVTTLCNDLAIISLHVLLNTEGREWSPNRFVIRRILSKVESIQDKISCEWVQLNTVSDSAYDIDLEEMVFLGIFRKADLGPMTHAYCLD